MKKTIRRCIENGTLVCKYVTENDVNKEIEEFGGVKEFNEEDESLRKRIIFDIADGSKKAVEVLAKLNLIAIKGWLALRLDGPEFIIEDFKNVFGGDSEKFERALCALYYLQNGMDSKNVYEKICIRLVGVKPRDRISNS